MLLALCDFGARAVSGLADFGYAPQNSLVSRVPPAPLLTAARPTYEMTQACGAIQI